MAEKKKSSKAVKKLKGSAAVKAAKPKVRKEEAIVKTPKEKSLEKKPASKKASPKTEKKVEKKKPSIIKKDSKVEIPLKKARNKNSRIQGGSNAAEQPDQDIFSDLEFSWRRESSVDEKKVFSTSDGQSENKREVNTDQQTVDEIKKNLVKEGIGLNDSDVFYLTEEHNGVVNALFAQLLTDSPFGFIGSFDKILSEYYKEIIFDQIRKSDYLSILYFDPNSGPDLLTVINGALKEFDLGEMEFSQNNHKRTILALDNENAIKASDWELLDVLRVELKKADIGAFCLRPETFGDDFVDKVTQIVKKFKYFNFESLSVLEMETLEEYASRYKENTKLQNVFLALKNNSAVDEKKQGYDESIRNSAHTEEDYGKTDDESFLEKFFKKIRYRE